MSGRPWTPREDALLRQHWGRKGAWAICAMLPAHRTLCGVYQRARTLGLDRLTKRHSPAAVEHIRRLHAQGLSDAAIAKRVGIGRRSVCDIRADRLGLPVNAAAILRAKRRAVKTQQKVLNVRSPAELRPLSYQRYAVENGWPEDLRPREVQILNVLAAQGVPMTRLELAKAIGMRTDRIGGNGSLALLTGNGPGGTYTASLMRRGLVATLGHAGPRCKASGKGCGRRLKLYLLGPQALAILQERAQACEATTATSP